MLTYNAYNQCSRLCSNIESFKSTSMAHWFLCQFKTHTLLSFLKAGNKHQKLCVSCATPQSMFNDYIYIHNDKEFDVEILHFAGGKDRLSTKCNGLCPYSFGRYFFNFTKNQININSLALCDTTYLSFIV